jgi:transcriptional regulator with XRE-family HTH domain
MGFTDMLKEAREKKGLSQSALAAKAGLPLRSLQNWEQGRRVPRLPEVVKLAKAVDTPLDQLLLALAAQANQRRKAKGKGKKGGGK